MGSEVRMCDRVRNYHNAPDQRVKVDEKLKLPNQVLIREKPRKANTGLLPRPFLPKKKSLSGLTLK